MSTSTTDNQEPAISKLRFEGPLMRVHLSDGRQITVPTTLYPRLHFATQAERRNHRLIAKGRGIHWPDLEEDISLSGLLARKSSAESPQSIMQWLLARKTPAAIGKSSFAEIRISMPERISSKGPLRTRRREIHSHQVS
ncbi:MAG TPA: DUF2442 domain-containing protein [Verrucomicrobiales bacterium]|nr:DUF2442 domain-containing protein [Verrucomicrobiales bacterium]HRJ07906.1 DUF2442 domain-containing protein [Prosthecobacter sp.]HRK14562.1 DUF2442 domain-containing protein [Prosthecobacter sp.]